jgi:hypothetical protein
VYLRVGGLAAGSTDPIGNGFTASVELGRRRPDPAPWVSSVTREQLVEAGAIAPVSPSWRSSRLALLGHRERPCWQSLRQSDPWTAVQPVQFRMLLFLAASPP